MSELETLRIALSQISEISKTATARERDPYDTTDTSAEMVCTPKSLPKSLHVRAAHTASEVNPMNAPVLGYLADEDLLRTMRENPLSITVLTTKYWGPLGKRLTVSFMEPTPTDLRNRIVSHLNAWQCGVNFVFTAGTGQVRISRAQQGYWSYVGTDVLHIALNRPTMNLQAFTMNTPESEYRRVVRHEAGHTLGFPHEHMRRELVQRIDPEKAYAYFQRTQGWSRAMVDQQVLTSLDQNAIFGTPADQTSIMCYQLPAAITRDARPILGGADINSTDLTFAKRIYPFTFGASVQETLEQEGREEERQLESEYVAEPAFAD
jgi:Astacin (Peptidase family M12A)